MPTTISGTSITTAAIDLTTPLPEIDGGTGSSVFETPVKTALNATGSAPIYACRAWVNFNGTGTVSIRASGNVSSITDNGVGSYTVNFTIAMTDANYSYSGVVKAETGSGRYLSGNISLATKITTSVQVITLNSNAVTDCEDINVSIFR